MEEFKYYEALKRNRQEILAVIKIAEQQDSIVNLPSLIDKRLIFSRVGILESGQTTEAIESKKFDKSDLEVFTKIIDAISKNKEK